MIKVIPPGSFAFDDPVARLVDVWSQGVDKAWAEKRAAVLTREISDIRPEPGHSFIHLISMGAHEAYGFNRNADAFNEKSGSFRLGNGKTVQLGGGLMQYHPTFMKYGHVYKHHKNDDPAKSIGEIKAAAYNPDMRRGELIIKVPHNMEWEQDLQKLASGKDVPFSMACKVANDMCTECGHRARTRKEYCPCLKDHISEITKQGNYIGAMNDIPGFFDISKVIRPADRIAWSLQKVAGLDLTTIGGAELAEQLGLSAPTWSPGYGDGRYAEKMSAANKLAEIEKHVDAMASGKENGQLKKVLFGCPASRMSDRDMSTLKQGSLNGVLKKLAQAEIVLHPTDFFQLVMGQKFSSIQDNVSAVTDTLPGMFNRLEKAGEINECIADGTYDSQDTAIPRHVCQLIEKLACDHSLAFVPVQNRAHVAIVSGVGPHLEQVKIGEKQAAASNQVDYLTKEYAKYLLSFVKESGCNELTTRLTVLRNYLRF